MKYQLEADGIMLDFGARRILADVYMKCEKGKITGLLGRNGQGKTCLMNIIYGTLPALSKSVRLNGKPIYDAFKRPNLLTYLPQFHFIPGFLTLQRVFTDFTLDYATFCEHFPEFKQPIHARISDLSGGQRRLIEVYVVLMSPAQFSMLDEPFSQLMPLYIERLQGLLKEETQRKGFLISDHLFQQVTDIADQVYLLSNGKTHLIKELSDLDRLQYAKIY